MVVFLHGGDLWPASQPFLDQLLRLVNLSRCHPLGQFITKLLPPLFVLLCSQAVPFIGPVHMRWQDCLSMDLLASQRSLVYFEPLMRRSVALRTGEDFGSRKSNWKVR